MAFHKKDRKSKKSVHMFFCFSIFEVVWCLCNLERLYIFLKKAVLRPPCWCYGGDSFMQKDRKSKNRIPMFFCFVIFLAVQFSRNLKLEHRYKNIIIAILQSPCWCYGSDSFMQKDRKSKKNIPMFFRFGTF